MKKWVTPPKLHFHMLHLVREVFILEKSILIIEDEQHMQNILKAFLEDAGYQITIAGD